MPRNVEVIFEKGVFLPLEPVKLREHQRGVVTIDETDCGLENHQHESAYQRALRLGLIGAAKDLPEDLSVNPEYFEGFGEE